jgi:hypothetical protein
VTQQWKMKSNASIETVMRKTREKLWEAVFFVAVCEGYIWEIETQASQSIYKGYPHCT